MKIKKGLALIHALAKIITLMPTMAFATTTNSVSRVVTVAANTEIPSVTTINLDTKDDWGTATQTIRLTLSNATWTADPEEIIQLDQLLTATATDKEITIKSDLIAVGENYVEFSMTPQTDMKATVDVEVEIRADVMTSGEEEGSVTVAIDGMDSQISSSTPVSYTHLTLPTT